MVANIIFWLNSFLHRDGIKYVYIHEENDNSLVPCTTSAIALSPTRYTQRSHYFLNKHSEWHVTCNYWTVLPIPTELINILNRLDTVCKQYKGIVFTDKHGNIINDDTPAEVTNPQYWQKRW